MLLDAMQARGFKDYRFEWWHPYFPIAGEPALPSMGRAARRGTRG